MEKSVQNYLLSKTKGLLDSRLLNKNNLSWLLFLCLSLTSLTQIASAQTIPNEGSPDWLWAKSAGGATADQATGVTTDAAGNVYTVGTFAGSPAFNNQTLTSAGATDIFISKHDASGNLIWAKRAGGTGADEANEVATDAAGNIYVAGTFSGTATFGNSNLTSKGASDIFIAKYSATGEVIWAKAEGNADGNGFSAFKISTAGQVYLAGSFSGTITIGNNTITATDDEFGNNSRFIAKYDNNGNEIWARDAGGEGGHPTSVTFDKAGNSYATGNFFDTVDFGNTTLTEKPGESDLFTVKYDADGNDLWAKQAVSDAPGYAGTIKTDEAGNVYINGTFDFSFVQFENTTISASSFFNIFLAKYDAAGNFIWASTVDGTEFSMSIAGISPDAHGNIFIGYSIQGGGRPMSNYPELNAYFKKYDQAGNVVLEKGIFRYGPPMESDEYNQSIYATNIITDDAGRIYFSFYFRGTANLGDDNLLTSEDEENTFTAIYDVDGTLLAAEKLALTDLIEQENHTYLAGSFEETITLGNTTLTSNGDTDIILAKLSYDSTPPPPVSTWNKTYGGRSFERLTSVVKTSDGGYLLGGHSLSRNGGDRTQDTQGRYDFWIVKTDAVGNMLWDKRYGGSDDDYLNQIIVTDDGSYLLAGSSKSGVGGDKTTASRGNQDFWIVKIDANGNKLWDQTYGGSGFEDLMQAVELPTGEFALAGVSASDISGEKSQNRRGSRDFWLVKVSTTGQKVWDQRYGGNKAEELTSLVSIGGGFILGGSSLSGKNGDKSSASKGGKDYWLVRTNRQGQLIWDKSFGGSGNDELKAMAVVDRSSTILVAGHSTSGVSGDKSQASRGSSDYWAILINTQGDKYWDRTYGGSGAEELGAVLWTQDYGWVLGGSSFSNQSGDKSQDSKGSSDYWAVKINDNGDKQWDQTYGGAGEERLRYLLQTEDKGYLLGGFSFSDASGNKSQDSQGRSDYWLVKIPPTPATQTRIAAQPAVELTPAVAARNFRAYPVPAREKVTVQFSLPETQPAVVQLYNSQGARVKTLFQGEAEANKTYRVEWQPSGQDSNGLYFLQLQSKHQKQSLKILLQK